MSKASVYAIAGIWAAALIATSFVLRGTPQSKLVIDILSSAVLAASLILVFSCRRQKERTGAVATGQKVE
jgi:hypothetical protein